MTICDSFKRLSLDTWDGIRQGRSVNFQLKEETFTDINMLALKVRHGGQVITRVFNKIQEGTHGADWEWWFRGLTGRWIGFRVQAKIINIQTYEFDHLHYRNRNTHTYQCDKLIRRALHGRFPKIPLYCLFIHTDVPAHLNNWQCGGIPFLKDFYGCSLTSAFTVQQLRANNDKHLVDLQNDIRPWHCLVCCKGYGGKSGDFITNIQEYAKANFNLGQKKPGENNPSIPEDFSMKQPPKYVLNLLENTKIDYVKPPDKDIDGVMIFCEQKEKSGLPDIPINWDLRLKK